MKLEDKEWVFLYDLLYTIHLTEKFSEFQKSFLELIRFLIPYDMASFYLASTNDKHLLADPVGINISKEKMYKYIDRYEDIDFTRWILLGSKSSVYRETDIVSGKDREENIYYKEAYMIDHIEYSAYVTLGYNGLFVGIVSLYRWQGNVDFSEKDLYILELVKDHLALRVFRKNIMKNIPKQTFKQDVDLRDYAKDYHLTIREADVFYLLFEELSDDEICHKLFISSSTFKKHISNIFRKFEVKNRLQLFKLVK